MKPAVLLTGGLGYVGGRVAQTLSEAGYEVIAGTRRHNLPSPGWLPQMRMQTVDWQDPASLAAACAGKEAVVHLAAMNEIVAATDPVGALQMNGQASLMLLEAAKAAGVRRFLYFSTARVYGEPLSGHLHEAVVPRPRHPYAITHKVAEDFVLAAHDQKNIDGIVVRLSNAFGAPATAEIDRWTLLVNDLCRQAASSGELRLLSDGSPLRDFIAVSDVGRAVAHLLALDSSQLGDGLFNLGSGQSVSILAMAERVAERWRKLTGRDIAIARPATAGTAPMPLFYDCRKLNATGFQLTAQVDEEIDATLRLCLQAFGK